MEIRGKELLVINRDLPCCPSTYPSAVSKMIWLVIYKAVMKDSFDKQIEK